jgi:hypothetical protein
MSGSMTAPFVSEALIIAIRRCSSLGDFGMTDFERQAGAA